MRKMLERGDSQRVKRDEEATANGGIEVKGSVEDMLENLGVDTDEAPDEENLYGEEDYGGRFSYDSNEGTAIKSALGPGYTLGAAPEDPRTFE